MPDKVNPPQNPIQKAPFVRMQDLGSLTDNGLDIVITATEQERPALAAWAGMSSVERLEATIRLSRPDTNLIGYDASFVAELTQACVVTLEPVPARLEGGAHRDFRLLERTKRPKKAKPGREDIVVAPSDDDEMETLEQPVLDLAAPILEELMLAIDPYPRSANVVFAVEKEPETPEDNPFAVLKALKDRE